MNRKQVCSECDRPWAGYEGVDGDLSACCESSWAYPRLIIPEDSLVINKEEIQRLVAWIIPAEDKHSKEKYNELRKMLGMVEV